MRKVVLALFIVIALIGAVLIHVSLGLERYTMQTFSLFWIGVFILVVGSTAAGSVLYQMGVNKSSGTPRTASELELNHTSYLTLTQFAHVAGEGHKICVDVLLRNRTDDTPQWFRIFRDEMCQRSDMPIEAPIPERPVFLREPGKDRKRILVTSKDAICSDFIMLPEDDTPENGESESLSTAPATA